MTTSSKRKLNEEESSTNDNEQISKKNKLAIVPVDDQVVTIPQKGDRTSGLFAPNMLLTGHNAAVYSMKFDPTGAFMASSSFDKTIFLWYVYGECENYRVLKGHKNAVLEVQWTYDSSLIASASADKTVGLWDVERGSRMRKFVGHSNIVNSVDVTNRGNHFVVSGGDDGKVKIWDARLKRAISTYEHRYQLTSVRFSSDHETIYSAGIDGNIQAWDRRNEKVAMELTGHNDVITSIALSPNGNFLVSNGMDQTVRKWDIRPYVQGTIRHIQTYYGAQHNFERNLIKCGWSANGTQIISGSSDRQVYIWNEESGALEYQLPGHKGCVNEAVFHPKEAKIIGSCGSDKQIFLGELAG